MFFRGYPYMLRMSDIEKFEYSDYCIFVSKLNGNIAVMRQEEYLQTKNLIPFLDSCEMFYSYLPIGDYNKAVAKTVVMSVHVSSSCNMSCKYCFKKERKDPNLTIEEVKKFIDMVMEEYPDANRYLVDMAGSGEPLLNKKLVLQTAAYCSIKSDRYEREVLPMLVSNGLLLDVQTVKNLQDSGILFGVSIDGDKAAHNQNRVDNMGKGTYDRILANVKNIAHRDYVGAAATVSVANKNVLHTFRHLSKYFSTVSLKPVRDSADWAGTVDALIKQYDKLAEYLLAQTKKNDLKDISAILNGDDYFGKFLLRVLTHAKIMTRCDAGIARFSLGADRKIYACPAACGKKEFVLGALEEGLCRERITEYWELLSKRAACKDCYVRFVCGGECMLVSFFAHQKKDMLDQDMCRLKKRLYELALIMYAELTLSAPIVLKEVKEIAKNISKRNERDDDLINTLHAANGKFTYTQLKKRKDKLPQEYADLKTILFDGNGLLSAEKTV